MLTLAGCSNPEKAKAEHLARGEAFLKEKKFQEASLEFRNVLQIDETSGRGHWGLAQAYEGLQRFQEAVQELQRAVDADPNNLDARVRLGNYYLVPEKKSQEMIANAERLANEVLQKDPNHIEGHILKATVLYAQNHPDQALNELRRAIEINPQRIESYLSLARFYQNTKDIGKAEETFKQAIAINENSALAHTEYGKFLVGASRTDAAEAEFRRAVEVEPTNYDSRYVLASFYFVNNRLDKAEESYKALADLDKEKPEGRAILADFYASVNRLDDSIRIYQDLVTQAPDYARARYRLGEILLQRGDVAGATAQADAVLKTNERDMQAKLLHARIRLQENKPKEAIEDLKEVLKQEPNSRAGLYFMAQANFAAGQIEQARAFAGDLERFYPDDLPAKLMQAQINLAAGDSKTALRVANEMLESLSTKKPDSNLSPQFLTELYTKGLTARGTAQLGLNDTTGARASFEAARSKMPNSPGAYINLAAVALREGNLDEGAGFYHQALTIDRTNFDALNGLINVYSNPRQNHLDQAHALVDEALSAQPNNAQLNASLHFLKAQAFGYQKNADGAAAELRRALELDPNYFPAYGAYAALFVNTNQVDNAIAQYRKIIDRQPDNASAYTLIGILEDGRQNYDAANENYRKALQIDPNATIAANNLAWSYAAHDKGNLDEAVRLAQGTVQKFPEMAGFADTLGWVYYKKGLYGAAVEQLQKAVAGAKESASYHFHLGMALAGKGDKAAARRELEQALSLGEKNKDFAQADEARKTLASL